VVNDGTIVGSSYSSASYSYSSAGVNLFSDSTLGGTLTNTGSISGNSGTAVAFGGTGSDLLVLDPGFGFSGIVAGGTSSSNTWNWPRKPRPARSPAWLRYVNFPGMKNNILRKMQL
jgi:hypothetical protein